MAAARNIDDIAYVLLTSASGVDPTMNEDSTPLFDTGRTTPNYITGGGSVLADAGMLAAKLRMRAIKKETSGIQVTPKYLLMPPDLENTGLKLIRSQEVTGFQRGQRAHIGGLGKLGKFAPCVAFGYILLSLDGWNLKEKQQEDRTDGRNDCESQVRC